MSGAMEVGKRLVELFNAGQGLEAVDELYGPGVVSIEGADGDAGPARTEGFDAVRGKSVWFFDNHEVHSENATGPFVGLREDQFVVQFSIEMTPKASGERTQLSEVGIYTVAGGKVTQEEFLYLVP